MKPRIIVLLAVLIVGVVIVSPVCALGIQIQPDPWNTMTLPLGRMQNLSYDMSAEGKGITRITFDAPTDTRIDFTLFYGNGSSVDGYFSYNNIGFMTQRTEVSIGGVTSGYDFYGYKEIGRIEIVGYARNWTTTTEYDKGFVVYDSVFGISEGKAIAFYKEDGLSDGVVYAFIFASDRPVDVTVYTNTRDAVAGNVSKNIFDTIDEWVNFALSVGYFVFALVSGLFQWLKFFFIDNLLMTISLYLAITMAYAACTSKNIFLFFRKFFNDQRKLFEFILGLWKTLIEILSAFRGIFRI